MSETIDSLEAVVAPKIAEMSLLGNTNVSAQIRQLKELGFEITTRQYNRIKKSDTYKSIMVEATDAIKRNAVAELVRKTSDLVPLIDSALRQALEDGNIQAVPHALKILGIDSKDNDKPQQAQQIIVSLPGRDVKDV